MPTPGELEVQRQVFLDEPTTGLDPVTKRAVWRTIEEAKQGKTIILTTHSMEEADSLAQYIAIMAAGQLRCIGTKERLKSRFASGYKLQILHTTESVSFIDGLVVCAAPRIRLEKHEKMPNNPDVMRSFYTVPQDNPVSYLYKALYTERISNAGRLKEFDLSFTGLEDVFLTIAHMVEPPSEDVDMTF